MRSRAAKRQKIFQISLRLFSLLVFALIWELAGRAEISFGLRPLSGTLKALVDLIGSGDLAYAFLVSFRTLITGFSAAAIFGVSLGLIMGTFRRFEHFCNVYLMLLLSMPTAALIPLILLTMGFGFVAESLIVFLFAVPIIAINTHTGVLNIEASLIQMSRCFLASRSQLFRKVILPGSVPMMMAGLRLGLSRAFIGMITAELILSPLGLGRLISISTSKFQYERLFAVILSILIAAALILDGMQRVERRLLHWRH